MKTRYDLVVRIGKHQAETLRTALRDEMTRVAALADEAEALAKRIQEECALAAEDWTLSTDDWLRVKGKQAEMLAQRRAEAEAELIRLRDLATQAYGKLRAAERATQAYMEKAKRDADRKRQAEADDLAGARRLLKQRRRLRTPAQTSSGLALSDAAAG